MANTPGPGLRFVPGQPIALEEALKMLPPQVSKIIDKFRDYDPSPMIQIFITTDKNEIVIKTDAIGRFTKALDAAQVEYRNGGINAPSLFYFKIAEAAPAKEPAPGQIVSLAGDTGTRTLETANRAIDSVTVSVDTATAAMDILKEKYQKVASEGEVTSKRLQTLEKEYDKVVRNLEALRAKMKLVEGSMSSGAYWSGLWETGKPFWLLQRQETKLLADIKRFEEQLEDLRKYVTAASVAGELSAALDRVHGTNLKLEGEIVTSRYDEVLNVLPGTKQHVMHVSEKLYKRLSTGDLSVQLAGARWSGTMEYTASKVEPGEEPQGTLTVSRPAERQAKRTRTVVLPAPQKLDIELVIHTPKLAKHFQTMATSIIRSSSDSMKRETKKPDELSFIGLMENEFGLRSEAAKNARAQTTGVYSIDLRGVATLTYDYNKQELTITLSNNMNLEFNPTDGKTYLIPKQQK
jgi:hypothetical protein